MRISSPAMGTHRDGEGEGRPLAGLALEGQRPPVELDEPAREGEAEPRPLALARVVRADLAKLLEHRGLILGRDPDAGIAHRDLDPAVVQARAHRNGPSLPGELDRFGPKV